MSARTERRLHPITLPALAACFLIVQVWTFRWGVITFDTVVQYAQVLSGRYEDWHPPVTAFLWRWLGGARWGGAPFLLMDCALYWSGLLLLAESLRRQGRGAAAFAMLAVGLLPIPFGQMGAVLKDPLLAACCLAAAGLLAISGKRITPRLLAAPLLLVAGATRFNAIVAAAPLLLLCAAPDLWRRPRLASVAGLAACAAALVVAAVLLSSVLQPRRTEPIFSLVDYDLAGTSVFAGRSVYPADADPGLPLLRHCYDARLFGAADPARCDPTEDAVRDYAHRTGTPAARLWLAGVAQAPLAYLSHRLAHFNRNQRWLVATVPGDAIFIASEPNELGLSFAGGAAAGVVYRAATALAWSPPGRPATWLAAALGLCLLGTGGRLPPLALALAASALLYGGGYALVSVADDLRYNLWTMLAAMLAWLLVATEADWAALPPLRRRLALALPLGAVAGEIAALFA